MAEPQDAQRPQLELLDMPPELLAEVFLRCSQETKHAFRWAAEPPACAPPGHLGSAIASRCATLTLLRAV